MTQLTGLAIWSFLEVSGAVLLIRLPFFIGDLYRRRQKHTAIPKLLERVTRYIVSALAIASAIWFVFYVGYLALLF